LAKISTKIEGGIKMKKFWKSKTIWINLVVAVVFGIAGVPLGINPETEIAVFGAINIILRFATEEKIGLK